MTTALAQAIANYVAHPSLIRRELGMALIRDGHLAPAEERRLREVLNERHAMRSRR